MPIKLNWSKGKNLGLALIFLGIMGLFQIIFIAIAQYAMGMGSIYAVVFLPIGQILATTYAIIVIFESGTSMTKYRDARPISQKLQTKKNASGKEKIVEIAKSSYIRPLLIIMLVYAVFFGIFYLILYSAIEDVTILFVIVENAAGIGSLIASAYFESSAQKKSR